MVRIVVLTAALAGALSGAATAHARPVPPDDVTLGSPIVRVTACDVTSSNRSATFYARMLTTPAASKLALRFTLLEKLGRDDRWSRVDVPALRQWHVSTAGVKRFGWHQTVENLRAGGAYKVRVQYRWLATDGAIVGSASRETAACRGPLPNLTIGEVSVRSGPTGDTRTYRIEVENNGKSDADSVDVALSVDHAELDIVTITRLAAGERRTVTFTGPECRYRMRVRVDPDNQVGERTLGDNGQLLRCP